MYKVYFVNFGYYSANESATLEGARDIARKAGFQSRVDGPDGRPVASWCPIGGWNAHRYAA